MKDTVIRNIHQMLNILDDTKREIANGISEDIMNGIFIVSEENQAFTRQIPNIPGLEELLCVKEEYLKTSIQAIEEQYGDFETYVKEEYGIGKNEIAILRERYLY